MTRPLPAAAFGTAVVIGGENAAKLDRILGPYRERVVDADPGLYSALLAIREARLAWEELQAPTPRSAVTRDAPMSTTDVADLKGVNDRTVRRAIAAYVLPATCAPGGRYLVDPADALAWHPRKRR